MDSKNVTTRGMVVTPHYLASQTGLAILREGGTAIEAMVAAAATISVVYPHMNSIGGDGFWLIMPPQGSPRVLEACGVAGSLATADFFKNLEKIPTQGPKSANTVAGTVGGWHAALKYVTESGYQRLSTARLLADAIYYAEHGFPASQSLVNSITLFKKANQYPKAFENVFFPNGKIPKVGEKVYQKQLAATLKHLADYGLDSFYNGEVAKLIAEDIDALGMPISKTDLENYAPVWKTPLRLSHSHGEVFNTPLPTQGLVSLAILGILDKLNIDGKHEGELIHAAVEATKQAFNLKDTCITDPKCTKINPQSLLSDSEILGMTKKVDLKKATLGKGEGPGDTIWMGIMDNKGFSVSFIQSIYYSFGSGVILPKTGIVWHNRGIAYNLDENHIRYIEPGKKPFHTLNPAAAILNDGRIMVYGTRGGDGQPQTQTSIFHRYVVQGKELQASISAPRWLFGNNHGTEDHTVKLENRFSDETLEYLRKKGHDIILWDPYTEFMGQAGALVRYLDGNIEGAYDPRSDGSAAGF